jgi:nucleoside phosphorylase
MSDTLPETVDFVILTALEEERDALHALLPDLQRLPPGEEDTRVYDRCDLPVTFSDGRRGVYRLATLSLAKMGRLNAATATADAIRRWRPRFVLLVGIAGGVSAQGAALGDVLVSDQVVDYELQKLLPDGPEVRYEVHRADQRLLEAAANFPDPGWPALALPRRPRKGQPTRRLGPIATGDKVDAAGVLTRYRGAWPRLIGIEMEAGGAATAAFQSAHRPGFFMVRGVSDLADPKKDSASVGLWRTYACAVAAGYAVALLRSGPVPLDPVPLDPVALAHDDPASPPLTEPERAELREDLRRGLRDAVIEGLKAMLVSFRLRQFGVEQTLPPFRDRLERDADLTELLQTLTGALVEADRLRDSARERFIPAVWRGLASFVKTPEFDMIVRQVYAAFLVEQVEDRDQGLDSIQTEYTALLSLHTSLPAAQFSKQALGLFGLLLQACKKATEALGLPRLTLRVLLTIAELNLLDERKGLAKSLAFLSAPTRPDVRAALGFEQAYRQQVAERHNMIKPPYFNTVRKLPIDRIYVLPLFSGIPTKDRPTPSSLDYRRFVAGLGRTVLLGQPGGGKSTLTLKLAYDLATRPAERLLEGRRVTPILVILREYGAERKERKWSLLEFIEQSTNTTYQIKPPPGSFEYLLHAGRLAVIFDGLDELLDTSYRQQIGEDIELFCAQYPAVPVLVTSREVGYDQAPLSREKFDHYRLAPFDDEQVQEYVTKWFDADVDLTDDQKRKKAEGFVTESRNIADLRSNPLMLALLCNIYRGEGYIPQNRPAVYEKCATMLFERWDKDRGLQARLRIEDKIRPAMMHLAHWIYADETLQGGVTEEALVRRVVDYLVPARFEDRDAADQAAREFVAFCRGRAWVFTDTGVQKGGESLYQFTHRTFLEYFAAGHLARTHETVAALGKVLLPRIARKEWDVVAQLAIQMKEQTAEGAADQILAALVKESRKAKAPAWNLLGFTARCLGFLVPSPRVVREITEECVARIIQWGVDRDDPGRRVRANDESDLRPGDLLGLLLGAAEANRDMIASSLEDSLGLLIECEDEAQATVAAEVMLMIRSRSRVQKAGEGWVHLSNYIRRDHSAAVGRLARTRLTLAHQLLLDDRIDADEFLGSFGPGGFFTSVRFEMELNSFYYPVADSCLGSIMTKADRGKNLEVTQGLSHLAALGRTAIDRDLPWFDRDFSTKIDSANFHLAMMLNTRSEDHVASLRSIGPDALFGAFVALAVKLEVENTLKDSPQYLTGWLQSDTRPITVVLRPLLLERFGNRPAEVPWPDTLGRCHFSPEQDAFVRRWIAGEVSFIDRGDAGAQPPPKRTRRPGGKHQPPESA